MFPPAPDPIVKLRGTSVSLRISLLLSGQLYHQMQNQMAADRGQAVNPKLTARSRNYLGGLRLRPETGGFSCRWGMGFPLAFLSHHSWFSMVGSTVVTSGRYSSYPRGHYSLLFYSILLCCSLLCHRLWGAEVSLFPDK